MRALVLALFCAPAAALAPVTQEEALAFHSKGLCMMMEPGRGITRADGDGWIVSSLPGPHRVFVENGRIVWRSGEMFDMVPGKPYAIHVEPQGARVTWCPQFAPPGREACGPVPPAFLYDATKALQ